MPQLNDIVAIKTLDESNVLSSIDELGLQCQQAWQDVSQVPINDDYSSMQHIILAGMGGSALGAEIIKALYSDRLKTSFEIVRDYNLPAYVDEKTLIILSSYSGTTEEVLEAAAQAQKTPAKIMIISSGGQLQTLASQMKYPYYQIDPRHNPSGQPRMALGYGIVGLIGLLQRAGLLEVTDQEIEQIQPFLEGEQSKYQLETPLESNLAKQIADLMKNRIPCVVSAEHLTGNAKTFCNQMNENAKNSAAFYHIPELNHHLMEGLQFPTTNSQNLLYLIFSSPLYSPRIQKRISITKNVIEKNNIPVASFETTAEDKLLEVFEMLMVGSYINFYVAMNNNLNPAPIPWVDYFKDELKK